MALARRPTLQLEDHILSAATHCLFNTFIIRLSKYRISPSASSARDVHWWRGHTTSHMATWRFMVLMFRLLQKLPNVKWVARLFYIPRPTHCQTSVHLETIHPVIRGPIQSHKANGATVQLRYDLYLSRQLQSVTKHPHTDCYKPRAWATLDVSTQAVKK